MNEPMKNAVKGIYYEYAGKRLQAIADLENLMKNTVGIGEHTHISEDIKKHLEEIDRLNSLLDTLNEQFNDITMGETDQRKVDEDSNEDDCCDSGTCDC